MCNVIISMYGVVIIFFHQSGVYTFYGGGGGGGGGVVSRARPCVKRKIVWERDVGGCTIQPSVPEVAFENLATMPLLAPYIISAPGTCSLCYS